MRLAQATVIAAALSAAACTSSHHAVPAGVQSSPSTALAGVQLCKPGQCNVDGPVPPDEPYRYVKPPPGASSTHSPGTARAAVRLSKSGSIPATFVYSDEQGPQISLYFSEGSLTGPTGDWVSISATPLAPTVNSPADGRIFGNLYRLVVAAPSRPSALDETTQVQLQLRVPEPITAGARYLIEVQNGTTWTDLATTVVGSDILQAVLPRLGVVAVVQTA